MMREIHCWRAHGPRVVFWEVLQRDSADRTGLLSARCGENANLGARVAQLLAESGEP